MGASVAPETIDDDLARIRSKSASPIDSDLQKIRSLHHAMAPVDTGDINLGAPEPPAIGPHTTIPRAPVAQADVTDTQKKAEHQLGGHLPGRSGRLGTDLAESAMETITHPFSTAKEIALTPGRAGYAVGKYAKTGEGGKEAAVGALQTAAMLGAGPAEKLLEPVAARVLGETVGPIVAKSAIGAASGATFSPDRPAIGAILGGTIGAASGVKVPEETRPGEKKPLVTPAQKAVAEHVTEEREAPEIPSVPIRERAPGRPYHDWAGEERRADPYGERKVWTKEERDAHHAEQLGQYNSFERLSQPTHPDVSEQIFARGKTQPFPYQTVASLKAEPQIEYRHSGPSLNPSQAAKVRDALNTTFHAAADQVRRASPDLAAAGERAIASKANATHLGQVQTKWVTEGIDPKLAESFLPQLQLDRLNHLAARDPSLVHDAAFAKNLSDLESRIPQGFTDTPEFKQMAERYKSGILSQTESTASAAGLKPEQFANLPNGYVRLVANPDAHPNTIAESVGGTGARQNPSTRLTTAQKATGTGAYTNSLAETVTADAMDKVVKARQNDFYKELLKSGTVLPDPRAPVEKGTTKIMFDDRANVIDDPAQAKITLQVPQSVGDYARHVWAELSRDDRPRSPAGRAMKTLDRATSTAALALNPAAATTHISTLSNILGSTPTPGAPLKALAGLVPGGKTALGVADWASVDRTSPKVRQLETDLSAHGGLRPEAREVNPAEANALQKLIIAAKKTPLKNANPHEWLFGENGVDKRVRLALAQRFIDSETARTGKAPAMHEVASFVNKKAGNYIAGNAGTLVNALQRSKASLFARMATARLSNAGKMMTGNTGMPGMGNRAQGLLLGTPGYLLGLEVLNELISGHSIASNQPGHHADLQYGTDEEGRPKYIRGSFMDPLSSTAMNRTGASSLLFDGSVRGAARDVENTALGVATSHPLTRAAFGAGLGKEPYITGSGDLKSVGHPSLDSGTGELKSRLGATASGLTSISQAVAGTTGGNEGMNPKLGKALKFLGPSITSVGSATENPQARERQSVEENWLKDRVSQIYRADPADRKQVAADIMAELENSDYSPVVKAIAKKQLLKATVIPTAVHNTISNVRQRSYAP